MPEAFDGDSIARQRIAEEAERRTGFLDLGGLGLTALPAELFGLKHLRVLNLGSGIKREDGSYHKAYERWDHGIPRNHVAAELGSLRQLPELRTLSVAATSISDLTPLTGLTALQSLDCSFKQVADLTPLAGLTSLQSLDCSDTQVGNLTPLAGLAALQSLARRGRRLHVRAASWAGRFGAGGQLLWSGTQDSILGDHSEGQGGIVSGMNIHAVDFYL